jgi:TonB family protein
MDRLQKRCFAVSLLLHGVLVGIVLFGSAFLTSREKPETIPVLTFIPDLATDGQFAGGGNRVLGSPAPIVQARQPSPPPVTRQSSPPPVTPPVRTPTREPDPVRPNNTRQPTVEARQQSRIQLPAEALRIVDRGGKKASDRKAPRSPPPSTARPSDSPGSTANGQRNRVAQRIQDSINHIGNSTSGNTTVESPGDGTGGPSYATYAAFIRKIYMDAWQQPEDMQDGGAITEVEIEVAKDGTVINSRIIEPSSNMRMDRSVLDVLRRVIEIKPFPPSWKEERRTFRLRFDLKVREHLLG